MWWEGGGVARTAALTAASLPMSGRGAPAATATASEAERLMAIDEAEFTAALGESHDLGVTEDTSDASDKGIYRISLDKDDRNQLDFIKG